MSAASVAREHRGTPYADSWLCRCPVPGHGKGHGDRSRRWSSRTAIIRGDSGQCFAGCAPGAILDALAASRK